VAEKLGKALIAYGKMETDLWVGLLDKRDCVE